MKYVKTDDTYYRILRKSEYIVDNYPISLPELASDLFIRYLESGAAEKLDGNKGSVMTWIKCWIDKELNNYIRKLKGLEARVERNMVRESDFDTPQDIAEDKSFNPDYMDLFVEPTTPEDLVSNKQTTELIGRYLSETDIDFLAGKISFQDATKESGLSYNGYKKLLNERLLKVRNLL